MLQAPLYAKPRDYKASKPNAKLKARYMLLSPSETSGELKNCDMAACAIRSPYSDLFCHQGPEIDLFRDGLGFRV